MQISVMQKINNEFLCVVNVTPKDLERIEAGKKIVFPFHKELEPLPIYAVIVGKEHAKEEEYKVILESGDNILPAGIGEGGIKILKARKKLITVTYPDNIKAIIAYGCLKDYEKNEEDIAYR